MTRAMLHGGIWGRLLVAVAVVGLVVSGGCTATGTDEAFNEDVAAELDAVVERGVEQTAAGGLVARVDAPAGQRTMPQGPADVDGEEELTGDEAFRIASITQLFTATVALQLAEEGVVAPDAPAYSNIGYNLAGAVIEAATGEPLEAAYRSRILEPLRMEERWLDCLEEPRGELAAGIHPPDMDSPIPNIGVLPAEADEPLDAAHEALSRASGAAGGLVSAADDVTVFARALFGGELFDDRATLEAMLEPGPRPRYGLGVELGRHDRGSGSTALI